MDSYMEIYDPVTGKRKRQSMTVGGPLGRGGAQPYQMGKSREQGANGVTRGGDGWSAFYRPSAPTMAFGTNKGTTNAGPITADVTSQKGFNQILGVIAARNNAKLQSMNNRVLASLQKAAMMKQAQENATRMRVAGQLGIARMGNETKRRGQDIDKELGMKRLGMTKRQQDIMSGYYAGQLANQGEANRVREEALALKGQPKKMNPLDAAIKRKKIVPDADTFSNLLPDDIRSEIGDVNKERAYQQYLETGTIPKFKKVDSTFDVDYEPITEGRKAVEQAPKITPDHIQAMGSAIAKDYGIPAAQLKIDYQRGGFVSPKNPNRIIPFDAAYQLVFGDN